MGTTFGSTKLVVGDLEGMSEFYEQAYELRVFDRIQAEIHGDAIDEIMLGVDAGWGPGSLTLLVYPGKPAPRPGGVILVFQTDDLDALVERVVEAGGAVREPIRRSEVAPVRVAFLEDPEGNLAECIQLMG